MAIEQWGQRAEILNRQPRGPSRDVFPPELGEARFKEPIHHGRNTLAHGVWGDKTPPDVEEIFIGEPLVAHSDPLQPRPGPEPIQGQ